MFKSRNAKAVEDFEIEKGKRLGATI